MTTRARKAWVVVALLGVLAVSWSLWGRKHVSNSRGTSPSSTSQPQATSKPQGAPGQSGYSLDLASVERKPDTDAKFGLFEGRVRNRVTGAGVSQAELSFVVDEEESSAMTDKDGNFLFEPTHGGDFRVQTVTAAGFLPYAPDFDTSPIRLTPRPGFRVRGIEILLSPAIKYEGIVMNAAGKPVADATIELLETADNVLMHDDNVLKSGKDGRFTLIGPDQGLLQASHPDHGKARIELSTATLVNGLLEVRLIDDAVFNRAPLAGRVVDQDKKGVAAAYINMTTDNAPTLEMATDDQGYFHVDGENRTYRVTAQASGFGRAQVSAKGGDVAIELVLKPEMGISGRVLDETGLPVPAFSLVVSQKVGPIAEQVVTVETFYDADGKFAVRGLGPGSYVLVATSGGHAPSNPTSAVAGSDAPVIIKLDSGGRLVGVVKDTSGKAIAAARVALEGSLAVGTTAVPINRHTQSDPLGQFEILGVKAGTQSIVVTAAGHHSKVVSPIEVGPGQSANVEVVLTPLKPGETSKFEIVGIGLGLTPKEDGLAVTQVVPDGGAFKAGIQVDDVVLGIDGKRVIDLGFEAAIRAIRGPEGTKVKLRVRKKDGSSSTDIDVVRSRIQA